MTFLDYMTKTTNGRDLRLEVWEQSQKPKAKNEDVEKGQLAVNDRRTMLTYNIGYQKVDSV